MVVMVVVVAEGQASARHGGDSGGEEGLEPRQILHH